VLLTSSLLDQGGFRHGFFTREGGVSEGPFASLNFSALTGDDPALVQENLARAAARLGVAPARLFVLSQVHGVGCRQVTEGDEREIVAREEGDAVLAARGALACAVRVADCTPILVGDHESGAVAAIHAGWRGVELGIVGAAIQQLRVVAGPRARLAAAIGPHISFAAFEVGDDVADRLVAISPVEGVARRLQDGRMHVDLRRIVEAQLRQAGVGEIDHVEGCTVREPARFFSFRRDGQRSGRHLAAIVPR
jgi:hypothetical protein